MTVIEAKTGALTEAERELIVGDKLLDLRDLRG
jgi:hypothetical protein